MPITQATMVELMRESRAAIQNNLALRNTLQEYVAFAKQRYRQNLDLVEVLVAIETMVRMHPEASDKATYRAEYHYRRVGKHNDKMRLKQEASRRNAGVPTQDESLDALHAANARRLSSGVNLSKAAYAKFNQGVILPREYPDDKPLEFETLADLPKPQDTNLTAAPSFSLDEPEAIAVGNGPITLS